MENRKKLVATKANCLVEAGYTLTLQEQRFILLCISKVNPFSMNEMKTFTVTALEFYESFEAMGRSHAEEYLFSAVRNIWDRSIEIRGKNETEELRWVQSKIKYHTGEGKVTVTFSDGIMPYLTEIKAHFSSLIIKNISELTTPYSIRLYELLNQYRKAENKERYFPIDEFKFYLGLTGKYPKFAELNRRVIAPSVSELNKKSDFEVTYVTIKEKTGRGGKIKAIKFFFKIDKEIKRIEE